MCKGIELIVGGDPIQKQEMVISAELAFSASLCNTKRKCVVRWFSYKGVFGLVFERKKVNFLDFSQGTISQSLH